jgi:Helicase HerA, central domain
VRDLISRTAPREATPRRGTVIGPYVVEGDRVRHPNGDASAVLRTGELDIEQLDTMRRAAVLAAFSRLCHTLEAPLQLVVRVRREAAELHEADGGPVSRAHAELDDAMREHWAERLRSAPAFRRDVLIATRAATPDALASQATRVAETARAMGVTTERLQGDALAESVASGLGVGTPVRWRLHPQYFEIGGVLTSGFALRRLPGHPVTAGWLAPVARLTVECDIAIHLAPAPLGDALSTLGRRLRDFSAHRMLEAERGAVGDVHVDIALDSAYQLRGRLARSLGRPLHLSITTVVRAPTHEKLRAHGEAVRLAYQSALTTCEPAHFRHLAAFVTTLPLAVDALGATKLVESSAAATCAPWLDAGCADPAGYRLGEALRSRAPVRVAPFDTARHANANVAILATSGHGKSFAMGTLVLEAAARGVDSVIIDPEGEYRRVIEALHGTYLSLAPGTDSAVNIFDTGDGDADEAVAGVVDLVSVLCGGRLSDVERALIDAAARRAIETAGAAGRDPVLGDCLPQLERDAPQVATVVRRFCGGALGKLFNHATSVHLGQGVCAISLRDTPAEHMAAATLLVARWLWRLVRQEPRPRHIVFDEVGALCVHPPLRALLVQLARRCRKYGASLVVATQNAQDLLGTDEGSVVATNCAIVLLGGHRPVETARMEHAFGLTQAQRRFLETATRGEFLLLAGDRRVEMRVEVPARHRAILSQPP